MREEGRKREGNIDGRDRGGEREKERRRGRTGNPSSQVDNLFL